MCLWLLDCMVRVRLVVFNISRVVSGCLGVRLVVNLYVVRKVVYVYCGLA